MFREMFRLKIAVEFDVNAKLKLVFSHVRTLTALLDAGDTLCAAVCHHHK